MNKNIKNNDHESFMEGIYGCMERIEAGIIELQKFKQSDSSSVNDNSANDKLVQDLKVLINENNKQGFEYTEAKIKKFAAAVVQDLNILNNNVKDAKSVIVNAQPSTEILNSLNEIKTSWKIQCKLPPKTKRFCPLKTFNNAPLKSLDRWGYYYFRF